MTNDSSFSDIFRTYLKHRIERALLFITIGLESVRPTHPSPSLLRSSGCSATSLTRTCRSGLHPAAAAGGGTAEAPPRGGGAGRRSVRATPRRRRGRQDRREPAEENRRRLEKQCVAPRGLRPRLLTAVPPGRMRAFHDEMIGRRPAPHDPARGRTPRTGEAGPTWVAPGETRGGRMTGRRGCVRPARRVECGSGPPVTGARVSAACSTRVAGRALLLPTRPTPGSRPGLPMFDPRCGSRREGQTERTGEATERDSPRRARRARGISSVIDHLAFFIGHCG